MPGECVLVCERAGAPVIRVTVFTFPLRRTGAQAARGEGGALHCAASSHECVCLCVWVSVWGMLRWWCSGLLLCNHSWTIPAVFSWARRALGAAGSHWMEGASYFFHSLSSLCSLPPPLSTTKVFIDYLVLLFNNLILGDSVLCSHRN